MIKIIKMCICMYMCNVKYIPFIHDSSESQIFMDFLMALKKH